MRHALSHRNINVRARYKRNIWAAKSSIVLNVHDPSSGSTAVWWTLGIYKSYRWFFFHSIISFAFGYRVGPLQNTLRDTVRLCQLTEYLFSIKDCVYRKWKYQVLNATLCYIQQIALSSITPLRKCARNVDSRTGHHLRFCIMECVVLVAYGCQNYLRSSTAAWQWFAHIITVTS